MKCPHCGSHISTTALAEKLHAQLKRYLTMPSLDGRLERQPLRQEMQDLVKKIEEDV